MAQVVDADRLAVITVSFAAWSARRRTMLTGGNCEPSLG